MSEPRMTIDGPDWLIGLLLMIQVLCMVAAVIAATGFALGFVLAGVKGLTCK